jgi:hypothetical protein
MMSEKTPASDENVARVRLNQEDQKITYIQIEDILNGDAPKDHKNSYCIIQVRTVFRLSVPHKLTKNLDLFLEIVKLHNEEA